MGICCGLLPGGAGWSHRFGNLRDSRQGGAFYSNLNNAPDNRRWNIAGRTSGRSCRKHIAQHLPSATYRREGSPRPMPKIKPSTRLVSHQAERRHSPDRTGLKTYCKHTKVDDPQFVREAIDHYLKGKTERRDVRQFLAKHRNLDHLAAHIASEIHEKRFKGTHITYFDRIEPISGKHRIIGRESVLSQIYDHVAVLALMPLFEAKIGRWQCASIPNRGTIDARRAIKRWSRERSSKWFVKLDVRKYYSSLDRNVLKAMLARDVGDQRLLALAFHLIDQYQGDRGLNIGSYLSQWMANYYLSYAYHWAEHRLTATRTNRRTGSKTTRRLITHQLWYMDDLLLIGRSKRDLKIAARRIAGFLSSTLHVQAHPEWNVKRWSLEPVDMVGYTFRPGGRVNIRAGIFLRARRTFRKAARSRRIPQWLARRCASYYGYYKHSDSILFRRRNHIDQTMRRVRATLRNRAKQPPTNKGGATCSTQWHPQTSSRK